MNPIPFWPTAGLFLLLTNLAQAETPWPQLPLTHPQAAFVMSHAYAQQQGASAEWNKMEGVAYNPQNQTLLLAVSVIAEGMSDQTGAIQLPANPCGAVYQAKLTADFNITELTPLVVGRWLAQQAACDANAIANPDNITVDQQGRVWIGEDSPFYRNNRVWVYDPKTQRLKRFATLPDGAEVTGLHITAAGQLLLNVQHPNPNNPAPYNHGITGVVLGFNPHTDDFTELAMPTTQALQQAVQLAAGQYQILVAAGGETIGKIRSLVSVRSWPCDNPDGNGFVALNPAGSEGYLYTNYECTPGGISQLHLRKNSPDAASNWQVIQQQMLDFKPLNGTYNNCFASITPWNTVLSGEEYPAESAEHWLSTSRRLAQYLGHLANPYDYGYPLEIQANGDLIRHYSMGRHSVEVALVLPDQKTAYIGNDGLNRVLFKYVADQPQNLSAGTLYAAKITQQAATLAIAWLELGHSTDQAVYQAVRALDADFKVMPHE